ncbi:MAG: DNA repair exonuclease [Microthrixaceae bacterium]
MKFIHAADLHIDSPMRGLSRYEGAPEAALRGASRRAFDNLVRTAIDEEVDLVVLAGDVFDGDWVDFNTGLYFTRRLGELTAEGIKVVTLAGNHDAASKLTRELRLPDGAFKFDHDSAQTIQPEELDLEVAVHGQSYATRDVTTNLAAGYPEPVTGVFNIGVLHTALNGREGHGYYAPCSEDDLRALGYDYWALGHVHTREIVSEDPWIVFPGNIQGRNIRETGAKGFTVVTVTDGQVTDIGHREADTARWFNRRVDATDAESIEDVADLVRSHLESIADEADGRLAAVRVSISGQCSIHDSLAIQHEPLEASIRSFANELRDVWVEKVVLDTKRAVDRATLIERHDGMGELFATIDSLRGSPDQLVARFSDSFTKLRSKLPRETRTGDGVDPLDPDVLTRALGAAESHILAVLADGRPS